MILEILILHARRHCFNYIRESNCSYSKHAAGSQILKRSKSDEFEQQKQDSLEFWLPASKNILLPSSDVSS